MTPEERDLITGLFDRLKTVSPPQKDPDAERLIQQAVAAAPDAPYLLVQTLLVQEHALQNAQLRINQLQQQAPAQPQKQGSFLSGLFHHDPQQTGTPPPLPAYPSTASMAPSGAGGFLRGALTTAAGVAGGEMLFQGIESLLGHRSGAFGSMIGGGYGGIGGMAPGFTPGENVEVTNNYYNEVPVSHSGSFLGGVGGDSPQLDQSFSPTDFSQGGQGIDPGLGVDLGSNIDPGPDPGSFDSGGGFDSGSGDSGDMAV